MFFVRCSCMVVRCVFDYVFVRCVMIVVRRSTFNVVVCSSLVDGCWLLFVVG